MTFTGAGYSQSVVTVDIDPVDLKTIDQVIQEHEILKKLDAEKTQTIAELDKALSIAQKELELERKENALLKRIDQIKDMEIDALKKNFDAMKDVADRSLKLAEISKPKTSNWQLLGLAGLAIFLAGHLL